MFFFDGGTIILAWPKQFWLGQNYFVLSVSFEYLPKQSSQNEFSKNFIDPQNSQGRGDFDLCCFLVGGKTIVNFLFDDIFLFIRRSKIIRLKIVANQQPTCQEGSYIFSPTKRSSDNKVHANQPPQYRSRPIL